MKKKLLVLSASAILASNFVFDNNASAVVSENDYKSDALSLRGDIRPEISLDDYLDNLKNLMVWLTVGNFSGYDEPEYEEVFQKYQKRFLAELDAVIKCVI
ncbi:coagulase, partial [Staphylococcus agnetis]